MWETLVFSVSKGESGKCWRRMTGWPKYWQAFLFSQIFALTLIFIGWKRLRNRRSTSKTPLVPIPITGFANISKHPCTPLYFANLSLSFSLSYFHINFKLQHIWSGVPSKRDSGPAADPHPGHLLRLPGGAHHARPHRRTRGHRLCTPRPDRPCPPRCPIPPRLKYLKNQGYSSAARHLTAVEGKANGAEMEKRADTADISVLFLFNLC